jgi:hypothetical protein
MSNFKSKIILCCITPTILKEEINENSLYDIFKVYGTVEKILIFERNVLVKAFIEMEHNDCIPRILEELDDAQYNIGKINAYLSKKTFLKAVPFVNETKEEGKKVIQDHFLELSQKKSSPSQSFDNEEDDKVDLLGNFGSEFFMNKNRTFQEFQHRQISYDSFGDINLDQRYFFHKDNNHQFNTFQNFGKFNVFKNVNSLSSFDNLSKMEENKEKGKVLILNRININKLNCKLIMNLFGCFGNVKKIILNKENSYCLVEMENKHQANLCLKLLKKLQFFDNEIRIKISNYPFLNLKTLEKDNPPNVEFFYGHKRFFRYKNNLHIKVNPPSNQLHITSISKGITSLFLYELISQINEPEKIIKLKKKGSTNSPMFLVFFSDVSQSMEVLSVIHNENLNGKILKVSFSHTKI